MTTATEPRLVRTLHYIEFDLYLRDDVDESLTFSFETEWRAQPAVVSMEAQRHIRGGSVPDWHIWAKDSFLGTMAGETGIAINKTGDTTPTAHSRLSTQLWPLVEAWLHSTAYDASRPAAYAWGVKGTISRLRSSDDTRQVRNIIERFANELTIEYRDKLYALCDARDAYEKLYDTTRFPQ